MTSHPGVVRIGVLGSGFVAEFYLRALQRVRGHEVTAIGSRSLDKAASLAERFDVPAVVGSIDELVAREDVDLVVIALPHDSHVQAVRAAAAAGKAVICTKPLGRDAQEAAECLRLVTEAGVWHGYAESAVFAPGLVRAKEMVDAGAIGRVTWVRSREAHGNPHGFARDRERMGGGPLRGLGIHCVAVGRWFMGPEATPVEVFAWGARLARQDVEVEDSALLLIRFDDGRLVQVEASWTNISGLDVRNEIHGTHGWIGTDETGETGVRAFAGQQAGYVMEKAGSDRGWLVPVADEPHAYGYDGEMDHFVQCFRRGEVPRQTLHDGVIDNAIVDAGYRAMLSGQWERLVLPGAPADGNGRAPADTVATP